MIEKIKSTQSAFKYDPRVNELCLITEVKFVYRRSGFLLDTNPYGEEDLVDIENVELVKQDLLEFNCVVKNKHIQFEISSSYRYDEKLFEIVKNFKKHINSINDLDKIELFFNEGSFLKMYIYKNRDNDLIDSLTLLKEGSDLCVVNYRPWMKKIISNLYLDNKFIRYESANEQYRFELHINDSILALLKNLFVYIS